MLAVHPHPLPGRRVPLLPGQRRHRVRQRHGLEPAVVEPGQAAALGLGPEPPPVPERDDHENLHQGYRRCVCTVVISLAPAEPMPLLLLGFRDELTGRPWQPPARHWPGSPLVGGRDEQAGGTWLAVHPQIPRVACILNARGAQAPPQTRHSRGELPLRAAAEGQQALKDLHDDLSALARYDPFLLICADLSSALMLSWDGTRAALENFEPDQTHVITNAGHTYPPGRARSAGPSADGRQGRALRSQVRRAPSRRRPGRHDQGCLGRLAHAGRRRRPVRHRPGRDRRPARTARRPRIRHHVGQPGRPRRPRPALRLPAGPGRPDHLVPRRPRCPLTAPAPDTNYVLGW